MRLNPGQRIVTVVGLGVGLLAFGHWLTGLGQQSGWVGSAPLVSVAQSAATYGGLYPWVRLAIWLILAAVWTGTSLWLLRAARSRPDSN